MAVTGASGFIGSVLVEDLLERGHSVVVLTRNPTNRFVSDQGGRLRVVIGDLLDEAERFDEFLRGVDIVVNCAGQVSDDRTMRALHVDATVRLARAASGRIEHWIQLSSVGVYGPVRSGVVAEDHKFDPAGEYETTKAESEVQLRSIAKEAEMPLTILRPSTVYGAGMPNQSLPSLISAIRRRRFFFIGPIGAIVDYVHVNDVVGAIIACLPRRSGVDVFNISNPQTIESFVAAVAKSANVPFLPWMRIPKALCVIAAKSFARIDRYPLTVRRIGALTSRATYTSARAAIAFGYAPVYSQTCGIDEMVAELNSRLATSSGE